MRRRTMNEIAQQSGAIDVAQFLSSLQTAS